MANFTVRLINQPELHSAETHAEEFPRVTSSRSAVARAVLSCPPSAGKKRRRRQFLESYQKMRGKEMKR